MPPKASSICTEIRRKERSSSQVALQPETRASVRDARTFNERTTAPARTAAQRRKVTEPSPYLITRERLIKLKSQP
jgi:hypothetical protein